MNPLTNYLALGGLVALLLSGGFATLQSYRLKAAKAELVTLQVTHQQQLEAIAASSKEVALAAERDALLARVAQLDADKKLSDAVAEEAERRRKNTQGVLDLLREKITNEATSNPAGCLAAPVSDGTLERLRALDAGGDHAGPGSDQVRAGAGSGRPS